MMLALKQFASQGSKANQEIFINHAIELLRVDGPNIRLYNLLESLLALPAPNEAILFVTMIQLIIET
jgi:hypothetical protein